MKLSEITKCAICGEGLSKGRPDCYEITITQKIFNPHAINRAAGLETFFGGNVALARIMGGDEEIAQAALTVQGHLCGECCFNIDFSICEVWEKLGQKNEKDGKQKHERTNN